MRIKLQAALLFAAAFAAAVPSARADVGATLRLSPRQITVGQAAQLEIEAQQPGARVSLPEVPGLRIRPLGQRMQMTSINGVRQMQITHTYLVRADRPGRYRLSGVSVGGIDLPAAELRVSAGAPTPQGAPGASVAPGPSGAGATSRGGAAAASNDDDGPARAFLRLRVPKKRLYVGESVPFSVRAYFRNDTGVTLSEAPELSSDAFTATGLDEKPDHRETEVRGVPYTVLTWRGALTAAKRGAHELGARMPAQLTYRVRDRAQANVAAPTQRHFGPSGLLGSFFGGRSPFGAGSPFDDPMFRDLFEDFGSFGGGGLRTVQRDVILRDGHGQLTAKALPKAGRPEGFIGAVGHFELSADLPQRQLLQGEPATLRFRVEGKGNFDSVSAPGLQDSDTLRAYTPEGSFEAGRGPLEGTLRYEQMFSIRKPGEAEVPALQFSYFDPDAERYRTARSGSIAVHVAPAAEAPVEAGGDIVTLGAGEAHTPLARQVGTAVPSLAFGGVPAWWLSGALLLVVVAMLAAAAGAATRAGLFAAVCTHLGHRMALWRMRREMRGAASDGDAPRFFAAARRAMQLKLARVWHVRPESISAQDVTQHWPQAPDALCEVFRQADHVAYAPDPANPTDLRQRLRGIERQLRTMEVPS